MRCNDDLVFLPVSDWVKTPLLSTLGWTRNFLVYLIRKEIIYGYKDSQLKVWVTNEVNIRKALGYRDLTIKENLTEGKELGMP